jgi:hypothetical protein
MKLIAFWDIESCSLVESDRRFRGAYCYLLNNVRKVVEIGMIVSRCGS